LNAAEPKPAQRVVAFDLDGTLTRADTLTDFLIWRRGPVRAVARALPLIPALLAYVLGMLDRGGMKQKALRRFIKGVPVETLDAESKRYAKNRLPKLLRPQALAALRKHVAAGDRVILVTASPEFVAQAWADAENLELVATRLCNAGGRMTGILDGRNCWGPEKVRRLEEILGAPVRLSVAYGDSLGDKDMLAVAAVAHFRPFREEPARG
jgi:phosphatidylglycerophosphatase C